VIDPPALPPLLLLVLLDDEPQAASSGLKPSTPPAPIAPLAIASRRLSRPSLWSS
jgi:hypothetical protein